MRLQSAGCSLGHGPLRGSQESEARPTVQEREGSGGLTGPSSDNLISLCLNPSPAQAPTSSMGLTSFSRISKKETRGLECVIQNPSGLRTQKLVPLGSSSRGRPGHSRILSSLLLSSSVVLTRRAGWAALGLRPSTPASPRRRSLSPHASRTRPGVELYHHPQTLMGRTGSRARSWCWGWAWPCPIPPRRG